MRHMGGLRKLMPVTAWTFIIGSLALAGIFPLAGFWSKDAILTTAINESPVLFGVGIVVAFMTACYMGRAYLMTFEGEYRGHAHPHESPATMTVPLCILAALSGRPRTRVTRAACLTVPGP
jgi:NADH-quinone oxidoreductase subunit L